MGNEYKKSMQNVNFKSVEEFLDFLPEDELRIVEILRRLIFDCVPGITEKLSYNVPFYKKRKGVFFIWPASVLWGKKQTYEGVRFGFQQGYLLADEINFLDRGERKQVYWRDFTNIKETDHDLLKAYIFEAVIIDEKFK
ncbi:MAG: DUF1801 domain-containing protein [Bacteroidia bacterium]